MWCIRTGVSIATDINAQFPIPPSVHCAVAYRDKQHSGFQKFTAPLATASFTLGAVANKFLVNRRPLTKLCAIRRLIAEGLTHDGGRAKLAKNLRAFPFNEEL